MKNISYTVMFQGKEYNVVFVDFKRKIVHIANDGDVKTVRFKDISVSYKVSTGFNDSKSKEVFVGDIVKFRGAEYKVSNSPHLIPTGFDERKNTKDTLSECEVVKHG